VALWRSIDARALSELENETSADAFDRAVAKLPGVAGLVRGRVSRSAWERAFGHLVLKLELGIPIFPFDAITVPDHASPGEAKAELRLILAPIMGQKPQGNPPARTRFIVQKDPLSVWIRTEEDGMVRVASAVSETSSQFLGNPRRILARQPYVVLREDGKGPSRLRFKGDFGGAQREVAFTLYAFLDDAYPTVRSLHAAGVHGRVVHDLYELAKDGKLIQPPDVTRMIKRTVRVMVVKPAP
jgi:hypothetical protein